VKSEEEIDEDLQSLESLLVDVEPASPVVECALGSPASVRRAFGLKRSLC
jgi:hypothetical protein